MKKCKSCQKEIDSKATKCPHCQTDQRNWFIRHKFLTAILVIIFIVIVSSSANTGKKTTAPTGNNKVESTEKKEEGVTMEKFTSIKEGMTYEEVVKILGSEGEVTSSNELAGIKTVMYQWKGTTLGANMNATFQDSKMVSKAQFGLK